MKNPVSRHKIRTSLADFASRDREIMQTEDYVVTFDSPDAPILEINMTKLSKIGRGL